MEGLMLHAGAKSASLQEVSEVPLPEATKTYTPMPHRWLVDRMRMEMEQQNPGFRLAKEEYGLSHEGKRLFMVFTYEGPNTDEDFRYMVGGRNSYDKSMKAMGAAGGRVFCCDNLSFSGDNMWARMHTGSALEDVEQQIHYSMMGAEERFEFLQEEKIRMQNTPVDDSQAFRFLGYAQGQGALSLRQFSTSMKEWKQPSHPEFQARTLWSLYNACTEALKSSPVHEVLGRHMDLHTLVLNETHVVH